MLKKLFLEHPRDVGETYFEHQRQAFGFAVELIAAGLACAVHAVLPGLCVTSAGDTVQRLHGELSARRRARLSAFSDRERAR